MMGYLSVRNAILLVKLAQESSIAPAHLAKRILTVMTISV